MKKSGTPSPFSTMNERALKFCTFLLVQMSDIVFLYLKDLYSISPLVRKASEVECNEIHKHLGESQALNAGLYDATHQSLFRYGCILAFSIFQQPETPRLPHSGRGFVEIGGADF